MLLNWGDHILNFILLFKWKIGELINIICIEKKIKLYFKIMHCMLCKRKAKFYGDTYDVALVTYNQNS